MFPMVRRMSDQWEFDETRPKSVQIADEVEKRIRSGQYPPNHPIFEVRLLQEFGVARETARKATTVLRNRGLIRTQRGMGSYVNPPDSWVADE